LCRLPDETRRVPSTRRARRRRSASRPVTTRFTDGTLNLN
jgi:hypothetical protein